MNKTISAILETGRVSNLPTVWSNVILGWVIANGENIQSLIILCFAASLLYVGGCFLGDAKDVEFDTKNRPSRPIPSGILRRSSVWISGGLMLVLGLFGFTALHSSIVSSLYSSTLLTLSITVYALFHKKSPLIGLPLIGLCRGLLLWSSYIIFLDNEQSIEPFLIFASLGLTAYTMCFASVARIESSERKINFALILKFIMFLAPGALLLNFPTEIEPMIGVIVAVSFYLIWLGFSFSKLKKNKGAYVEGCLAGFALLDAAFISAYGFDKIFICLALFGLSLILQKISAAT